jgi:hypothetical protein
MQEIKSLGIVSAEKSKPFDDKVAVLKHPQDFEAPTIISLPTRTHIFPHLHLHSHVLNLPFLL